MNTKTRLIPVVALLGIIAVVLAVALVRCKGSSIPATTMPPGSATVEPVVSSTLLSSPTPSFTPRPTTMVSHHPTELPNTYFDLTLDLKATTTVSTF
jgi:hypothetical protein